MNDGDENSGAAPSADPVRVVGPPLPYRDEAETKILATLEAARDLSAGSDELEAAIDGWAGRYHLSAARGNLLRPFSLSSSLRVLEVGAGCGAISRFLGETGAQVLALEGSAERARAAAERCRDLANVEVVSGSLEAFSAGLDGEDDRFDLVVVVGVLEYAGAAAGGGGGAAAFLEQLRSLLRPDGNVLLAIENQLGLRYLLGGAEDHLGRPWVGVAGYPNAGGVRTWARRPLATLLGDAGFVRQRWLFPFPDYKLPKVVLALEAYEQADAVDFVDQLVGAPTPSDEREHVPATDERQAHRVFLEAGLGPDVANAFLVCAAGHAGDPDRLLDSHDLAWHASHQRRAPWRRLKTVRGTAAGRVVTPSPLAPPVEVVEAIDEVPWLRHDVGQAQAYIAGRTLEQHALAACQKPDAAALREVLARWNRTLIAVEQPGPPPGDDVHPLLPATATTILPSRFLDIDLANFVVDSDDEIHYIDDEWHARGGVDGQLARLRALWHLAVDLVRWRSHHPWPLARTPRAVIKGLAKLADLDVDDDAFAQLRRAEGAVFAAVTGRSSTAFIEHFDEVGAWQGPRSAIEAQLDEVLAGHEKSSGTYEAEIARRSAEINALRDSNASLRSALATANDARDRLRTVTRDQERQLDIVKNARVWRWYQRYLDVRRRLRS